MTVLQEPVQVPTPGRTGSGCRRAQAPRPGPGLARSGAARFVEPYLEAEGGPSPLGPLPGAALGVPSSVAGPCGSSPGPPGGPRPPPAPHGPPPPPLWAPPGRGGRPPRRSAGGTGPLRSPAAPRGDLLNPLAHLFAAVSFRNLLGSLRVVPATKDVPCSPGVDVEVSCCPRVYIFAMGGYLGEKIT